MEEWENTGNKTCFCRRLGAGRDIWSIKEKGVKDCQWRIGKMTKESMEANCVKIKSNRMRARCKLENLQHGLQEMQLQQRHSNRMTGLLHASSSLVVLTLSKLS